MKGLGVGYTEREELVRCWLHSQQRVLSSREVPTRKCRTKTVWDIISLIPQDPFYLKFSFLNLGQNVVSFDFIYGARVLVFIIILAYSFPWLIPKCMHLSH